MKKGYIPPFQNGILPAKIIILLITFKIFICFQCSRSTCSAGDNNLLISGILTITGSKNTSSVGFLFIISNYITFFIHRYTVGKNIGLWFLTYSNKYSLYIC